MSTDIDALREENRALKKQNSFLKMKVFNLRHELEEKKRFILKMLIEMGEEHFLN